MILFFGPLKVYCQELGGLVVYIETDSMDTKKEKNHTQKGCIVDNGHYRILLKSDSVKIEIYQNDTPIETIYTEKDGRTKKLSLPSGEYNIKASKQGYETTTLTGVQIMPSKVSYRSIEIQHKKPDKKSRK